MAASCSHWWHCPFYFSISILLAFMAFEAAFPSHPNSSSALSDHSLKHALSLNASRALRTNGFNFIATLLQISPELFLSSPESTIFAVQDRAISNVSVPPWVMKQLLQYHTSDSKLSFQELLKKPQGSCFATLVKNKKIAITKIDPNQGSLEINNVLISHPDLFLEGSVSIHGVVGTFTSSDHLPQGGVVDHLQDLDFLPSPPCELDSKNNSIPQLMMEWPRIVHVLSSSGFVSFSIGLQSVLDGILQDYVNLSSVTVFAPPNFVFLGSPSPLLERIARLHILPQRFSYMELASLPEEAYLKTLTPDKYLKITGNKILGAVAINNAEITTPDFFASNNFIIHGISKALDLEDLSSSSIMT